MNKKTSMSPQRIRERALFLYASALQSGDFDTVSAMLKLAERDAILDRMLKDLDSLEFVPEARAERSSRPLQNGKGIHQNVTIRHAPSDGRPSEFDPSQEDTDMMLYTTFEPTISPNPKTIYPFAMRFITLAAAILIVALVGGILIEMVNDPSDGYPGAVALQTDVPKPCTVDTATDPAKEATRLGREADKVLNKQSRQGAELSALLAICGLQTGYTPEADNALQRSLSMLDAVPTFPDHDWGYNTTVFSPDGKYLLVGGGYEATLWDIASGTKTQTFPYDRKGGDRVNPVAFSPDGSQVVTYHQIGIARVWDAKTGEVIQDVNFGADSSEVAPALGSITFSPDGAQILLGTRNGQIQVWTVNTWTLVRHFWAGSGLVASISYAPDSRSILTAVQLESAAILWDATTYEEIREFPGELHGINSAVISADGHDVLVADQDGAAILFDMATGDQISSFQDFTLDVNVVAFSPDNQSALIGSADLSAKIYDLKRGEEVRRFTLNDNYVASVAFSPDGRMILLGSVTGNVRLWPTTIADTIALACSRLTRDFTADERTQYGLGEGAACPK